MASLIIITSFLIKGFKLKTLDTTTLDETKQIDLLNWYNTYSGFLVTIVAMPIQAFVGMFVPVFFLCFTTKTIRKSKKTLVEQWAPVVIAFLVSWMLGQGMSSLNIQFDANTVDYVISTKDLRDGDTLFQFDLMATNIFNTSHVAGINSTNTILRRAIQSTDTTLYSSCTFNLGIQVITPDPFVRYGFRTNSWLQYMLPHSVGATGRIRSRWATISQSTQLIRLFLPTKLLVLLRH